jgi:hypothetical protein
VILSGTLVQSVVHHRARVSCLALSERSEILVMGSADTNISVWDLNWSGLSGIDGADAGKESSHSELPLSRPSVTYYEHSSEVMAVAASIELDLVCSGARDGTLVVRSLKRREYLRTIFHPDFAPRQPERSTMPSPPTAGARASVARRWRLQTADSRAAASFVHFTELALCPRSGHIVTAAVVFRPVHSTSAPPPYVPPMSLDGGGGDMPAGPEPASAPQAEARMERSHTSLLVHSINGRLLAREDVSEPDCQPLRICSSGTGGAIGYAAGRKTELLLLLVRHHIVHCSVLQTAPNTASMAARYD